MVTGEGSLCQAGWYNSRPGRGGGGERVEKEERKDMLPLEGVKVVELAIWLAGPACGVIMADCGADVVKVEHLETGGDPARGWTPTDATVKQDPNYVFETMNRGKRGIALDLSQDKGRNVLYTLCKQADVFVTNLRLSTLDKLRVNYDSIRKVNPGIVYVRGTGYGPRGPEKDKMGFDSIGFWARSGIMASIGDPGSTPTRMRGSLGDVSTGTCMFAGTMAALYRKARTGQGGLVDGSLLATGTWIAAENLWAPLRTGQTPPRYSRKSPPNPLVNIYNTSDDRWVYMTILQADRFWPNLCRAIGREDLIHDARFTQIDERRKNSAAVVEIIDEQFKKRTLEEWGRRLDAEHIAWGLVTEPEEVIAGKQVEENEYVIGVDHPVLGRLRETAIPFQIDGKALTPRAPSPEFGGSTEEVLLEAGYTWEEIAEMKESRVVI